MQDAETPRNSSSRAGSGCGFLACSFMLPAFGLVIGGLVGATRAGDPAWREMEMAVGAAYGGGLGTCLAGLAILARWLYLICVARPRGRWRTFWMVIVTCAILTALAILGEFLVVLP